MALRPVRAYFIPRNLVKWSWWESNPRPHKETIRFLHVYSGLHFRAMARPGPPTMTLSSKVSRPKRGILTLFPIYLHRLTLRFGTTSLEQCLVASPCNAIKPMIYYASIRQRERNYFRQLIFWFLWFRSKKPRLHVLTYHFISPSNPVNPEIIYAL